MTRGHTGQGKADLHIHTAQGDGMADVQELLDYVEERTDLDVVAITDHDDLRPAHQGRETWLRGHYSFQVVMGMEVTTLEGHLLALFIEEPVPGLRPLAETLAAVHRQGGLCIIPHPLSWLTRSIGQSTIERVIAQGQDGVYFDGIEVINETFAAKLSRRRALHLNGQRYRLAEVGGSDAHFLATVGSAYTLFPGSSAQDLRQAILSRTTRGAVGRHPSWRELGPGQILRQQWRGLLVTPRRMGWLPTIKSFLRRAWP